MFVYRAIECEKERADVCVNETSLRIRRERGELGGEEK